MFSGQDHLAGQVPGLLDEGQVFCGRGPQIDRAGAPKGTQGQVRGQTARYCLTSPVSRPFMNWTI